MCSAMFSLAYVILPFSDIPPADAIRASLSRCQRGLRGACQQRHPVYFQRGLVGSHAAALAPSENRSSDSQIYFI